MFNQSSKVLKKLSLLSYLFKIIKAVLEGRGLNPNFSVNDPGKPLSTLAGGLVYLESHRMTLIDAVNGGKMSNES